MAELTEFIANNEKRREENMTSGPKAIQEHCHFFLALSYPNRPPPPVPLLPLVLVLYLTPQPSTYPTPPKPNPHPSLLSIASKKLKNHTIYHSFGPRDLKIFRGVTILELPSPNTSSAHYPHSSGGNKYPED